MFITMIMFLYLCKLMSDVKIILPVILSWTRYRGKRRQLILYDKGCNGVNAAIARFRVKILIEMYEMGTEIRKWSIKRWEKLTWEDVLYLQISLFVYSTEHNEPHPVWKSSDWGWTHIPTASRCSLYTEYSVKEQLSL